MTAKILSNMVSAHPEPSDLDGFSDLREDDQARIRKAWQEGHVDPADIPSTQAQPGDKPEKKKAAPKKKKGEAEEEEGEDAAETSEKPKKARATKKVCGHVC